MRSEWSAPNEDAWLQASIHLASEPDLANSRTARSDAIASLIKNAMAMGSQGHVKEAIDSLKPLLKHKRFQASIHNDLGVLYGTQGQLRRGYRHFQCALTLDPNHPEALINSANYFCGQGDYAKAEEYYRIALLQRGECPKLLANLGHCLMERNKLSEALDTLQKAIHHSEELTTANFNLASVCIMLGDIETARQQLKQIVALSPTAGAVQRTLANCIRFTPDCQELLALKRAFQSSEKKSPNRMHLAFALGKAYEDIQEPQPAFRYISLANAILRRHRPYDATLQKARFTSNLRLFNRRFCQRVVSSHFQSDQRIIFLIGLPRCGSTLVHQILSMHPDVKACGESTALGNAILKEKAYDIAYNDQAITRIRDAYLEAHSNPGGVIIDKNLYNFYWAPLIFKVFPRSIIIEISRERNGHYWSLFKNYFSKGNEFTASLVWIEEFAQQYHSMLRTWRQELNLPIGQIKYEDIVNDTPTAVAELLGTCDLGWHEACLNPDRSQTPVRTASAYQVRQSVYKTSTERACLYAPLIEQSLRKAKSRDDLR